MAVPLTSDQRNEPTISGQPSPLPAAAGNPGPAAVSQPPAAAQHLVRAADDVLIALYTGHYRSLVRLSAILVGDLGTAEEVVQDCFVGAHGALRRLRDSDKALHYLRRSVVNRSRSVLRHRTVADRHPPEPEPDMPSAELGAIARIEQSTVISALRALPVRQREALVLRFYLDLSEEQVASAMKISRGAVKAHTARAKAALRGLLEAVR